MIRGTQKQTLYAAREIHRAARGLAATWSRLRTLRTIGIVMFDPGLRQLIARQQAGHAIAAHRLRRQLDGITLLSAVAAP
jgi:hypothetical protein